MVSHNSENDFSQDALIITVTDPTAEADDETQYAGSFAAGDMTVDYVINSELTEVTFDVSKTGEGWLGLGTSPTGTMTNGGSGAVSKHALADATRISRCEDDSTALTFIIPA
jgi:hypothetical protein